MIASIMRGSQKIVRTDLLSMNGRHNILNALAAIGLVESSGYPVSESAVLQSIRSMTAGQIWCVFGCGGDRDKGKRSLMGQAASMFADRTVLTNDNPRNEDPSSILDSILAGMNRPPDAVIEDRKRG